MHRPTPDQTAWWLVSVVGVGVVASMTATWLMSTEGAWVYAPPAIAILFIIVTVPGGVLSRERRGASPLGRGIALVILLAYLGFSPVLAATDKIAPTVLGIGLLATASTLLTWNALRIRRPVDIVAIGIMLLLLGVAGMLIETTLRGFIMGVVLLLLLVGMLLLLGVADLLIETTLRGRVLFWVTFLSLWVAIVLVGSTLDPTTVGGVLILIIGGDFVLGSTFTLPIRRPILTGIALLLVGVPGLCVAVTFLLIGPIIDEPLTSDFILFGVACLMIGAVSTLSGVARLRRPPSTSRANALRRWWTRIATPDDQRRRSVEERH